MFYCMFYFTCDRSLSRYYVMSLIESAYSWTPTTKVVVIVTSAEEGGYVFTSVCLCVCLSVRRITEKAVNGVIKFW